MAAIFVSIPVSAAGYRFECADGTQELGHYPPAGWCTDQPIDVYNAQGRRVRVIQPAKSEATAKREHQLEAMRTRQLLALEQQIAEDRRLRNTYSSEEALVTRRDGRLLELDRTIKNSREDLVTEKNKLGRLQKEAADVEKSGNAISKRLRKSLDQTVRNIERTTATIAEKEADKISIREHFDAELTRYRKLISIPQSGRGAAISHDTSDDAKRHALIPCEGEGCAMAWEKAQDYVRRYSTTPVVISGSHIVATEKPTEIEDISLTVSRIEVDGNERIFLDLRCRDLYDGKNFCKGDSVTAVLTSFKSALGVQ